MTPREFKAWFDGFTEGMSGRPDTKQWRRICKRVREIDGEPISQIVYRGRYYRRYHDWFVTYCASTSGLPTTLSTDLVSRSSAQSQSEPDMKNLQQEWTSSNAVAAMNMAGKAEFANL